MSLVVHGLVKGPSGLMFCCNIPCDDLAQAKTPRRPCWEPRRIHKPVQYQQSQVFDMSCFFF